jgi:hypothetical protein
MTRCVRISPPHDEALTVDSVSVETSSLHVNRPHDFGDDYDDDEAKQDREPGRRSMFAKQSDRRALAYLNQEGCDPSDDQDDDSATNCRQLNAASACVPCPSSRRVVRRFMCAATRHELRPTRACWGACGLRGGGVALAFPSGFVAGTLTPA